MITRQSRQHDKMVTRRSLMIVGFQGLFTAGLVGRLFYLQVAEGRWYENLSDRNKYDFKLLPPSRGRIYDAEGRLLAGNAEGYQLNITPGYTKDLRLALVKLSNVIDLNLDSIEDLVAEARTRPSFLPLMIRDNMTHREVSRVVIRAPELPGVDFERVEKRIYPQGMLTGHLTGYVGRVSDDDVKSGLIGSEMAHLYSGKSGVERAFEPRLRGQAGQERIVVNAKGRPVRKSIDTDAISGKDLTLTIDINLQSFATSTLKRGKHKTINKTSPRAKEALARDRTLEAITSDTETFLLEDGRGRIIPPETGSIVVIDVETGMIKSLISSPTFDPNIFSGQISRTEWNKLVSHPRTPLLDRSIKGLYSPGSTFKVAVALAALEGGIITPEHTFYCPGHRTLGDTKFHCWKKNGHGHMNVISAIEQSCDVFFYELGLETGIERIAAMARKLGLGHPTDIIIPGEETGLIPDKSWKKENRNQPWTLGETMISSIGQGYILTTPLQLAVMMARLANGRKAIRPSIVNEIETTHADLDISPSSLAIVRRGMEMVVGGARGTARRYKLGIDGVKMAGKTGTVQVKRITLAERERGIVDNNDRPWKDRDHALFIGYTPHDKPKYAIAVVVEHGGSGSSTAAPIARDVFSYIIEQGL